MRASARRRCILMLLANACAKCTKSFIRGRSKHNAIGGWDSNGRFLEHLKCASVEYNGERMNGKEWHEVVAKQFGSRQNMFCRRDLWHNNDHHSRVRF